MTQNRSALALASLTVIGLAGVYLVWQFVLSGGGETGVTDGAVAGRRMGQALGRRIDAKTGDQVVALLPGKPEGLSSTIKAAYNAFGKSVREAVPGIQVEPVDIHVLLESKGGDEAMFLFETGVPATLFDQAREKYPSSAAIVSFVGLPATKGVGNGEAAERPLLAAIDLMMLSGRNWEEWFRSGRADMLIFPRADVEGSEETSRGDHEKQFNEHFVLIDQGNWQKHAKDY